MAGEATAQVAVTAEAFPDPVFRSYVSSSFDTDSDGVLSTSELASAKQVAMTSAEDVSTMKGIELLTSVTSVHLTSASLVEADLSALPALQAVWMAGTDSLVSLALPETPTLRYVSLYNGKLKNLDLHGLTGLKTIFVSNCQNLETVDVTDCSALECLLVSGSPVSELKMENAASLEYVSIDQASMDSLDVSALKSLKLLNVVGSHGLTSMDVSHNSKLEVLCLDGSGLTAVDVSKNIKLQTLSCEECELQELKLPVSSSFKTLDVAGNHLAAVNLDEMTDGKSEVYFITCQNFSGGNDVKSYGPIPLGLSPQDVEVGLTMTTAGQVAFVLPSAVDTARLENIFFNSGTLSRQIVTDGSRTLAVIADDYAAAKSMASADTISFEYTYLTGHPKATESSKAALYRMRVRLSAVLDMAPPAPEPTELFAIAIADSIEGGSIEISPNEAAAGTPVTLTAKPKSGYKLSSIGVFDAMGNSIPLSGDSFLMPGSDVIIKATFVKKSVPSGSPSWICH